MVISNNKVNLLMGGWYVQFKDGSVITESEMVWHKVPNKKDIVLMGLKWRNKHYEITNKLAYIPPGEKHRKDLTLAQNRMRTVTTKVGKFIGYYDKDHKVIIRVDYKTGKFSKEILPYS